MREELVNLRLYLKLEGDAWGGFEAETEWSRIYSPREWPGLKAAIREACRSWGDCRRDSVRPFYGDLQFTIAAGEWRRYPVKLFDEADLARVLGAPCIEPQGA